MPPPLIGGGIKQCICLMSDNDDVCLTSVAYIVNIHVAHCYWKETRRAGRRRPGVRRVWVDRSVRRVKGLGHIVAASRLQLGL